MEQGLPQFPKIELTALAVHLVLLSKIKSSTTMLLKKTVIQCGSNEISFTVRNDNINNPTKYEQHTLFKNVGIEIFTEIQTDVGMVKSLIYFYSLPSRIHTARLRRNLRSSIYSYINICTYVRVALPKRVYSIHTDTEFRYVHIPTCRNK